MARAVQPAPDVTPHDKLESLAWRDRIERALDALKRDRRLPDAGGRPDRDPAPAPSTRVANLWRLAERTPLVVPLAAAALAQGCAGYSPGYKQAGAPHDYATTTTSGAVLRPDFTSDEARREQNAEREQRLEREMEERRQKAAALAGPEASADAQAGTTSPDQRAAFVERVRDALAALDADVDDLRARAAMAGTAERARIDALLKDVGPKRARLEMAKKRLDQATGDEWQRARDDVQTLLDETKQAVRAARDQL